jgi:hypothetical protein
MGVFTFQFTLYFRNGCPLGCFHQTEKMAGTGLRMECFQRRSPSIDAARRFGRIGTHYELDDFGILTFKHPTHLYISFPHIILRQPEEEEAYACGDNVVMSVG